MCETRRAIQEEGRRKVEEKVEATRLLPLSIVSGAGFESCSTPIGLI